MPYKNVEARRAYMKAYNQRRRTKNPNLVRNRAKGWNAEYPERKSWMMYFAQVRIRFNVSMTQVLASLHFQDYKCKCCGTREWGDNRIRRFCVDHDHATGQLRGLLCHRCNREIGALGDNYLNAKNRVASMLAYLRGRL